MEIKPSEFIHCVEPGGSSMLKKSAQLSGHFRKVSKQWTELPLTLQGLIWLANLPSNVERRKHF
jgi:hypothetical protein